MKPILSLVILIFALSYAFGQDHKKDSKKIQLGINYSPDYNYRTLTINNKSQGATQVKDIRNKTESPKFGYTSGLQIAWTFHPKLALNIGLQYSNKGYKLKEKPRAISESDLLDDQHYFATRFKYSFHYIDFPLSISYLIGKKRMQMVASIGVTTNIFIKECLSIFRNTKSNQFDIHLPSHYKYNKFNLSATIGCGINYHLLSKIDVRLEPSFRYQLLKVINSDLSAHLWNFGMNTAILYSF